MFQHTMELEWIEDKWYCNTSMISSSVQLPTSGHPRCKISITKTRILDVGNHLWLSLRASLVGITILLPIHMSFVGTNATDDRNLQNNNQQTINREMILNREIQIPSNACLIDACSKNEHTFLRVLGVINPLKHLLDLFVSENFLQIEDFHCNNKTH
jgi:hypothetical protein